MNTHMTLKETKTTGQSHPAYLRRKRGLKERRRILYVFLKDEVAEFRKLWWSALGLELRIVAASWSNEGVAVAIDLSYNAATDAGLTVTSRLLKNDAATVKIREAKARALKFHQLRLAAREKDAKARNQSSAATTNAAPLGVPSLDRPH
jgi:hypothetical protein